MKYNQYSYLSVDQKDILKELKEIGFDLPTHLPEKELFEWFVRKVYFTYKDTDYPLSNLVVDSKTDFLTYIQSDCEWSPNIFYTVALQLLGFRYFIDFEDTDSFLKEVQFPIEYGNLVENLYHLLNTRTVKGNLLIDQLVSDGLIPEDNQYHYFNGKSLATFTSHDAIREVVYVESRVDTDKDGLPDLVKVSIIRPRYEGKIPAVMTASPYHQGTNDKASDKALYNMNVDLEVKEPHTIQVEVPQLELVDPVGSAELVDEAEETLTHINSSYTLNDYLLPRGYAFTDHTRKRQVKADWSNGKVATTGISYLGTMSNGLATTGVDGLEVIIAEAGISSWYNYYRENGLVTSPGGYPGEDFDSLAELTYSRNLLGGDYLHHNAAHQADLDRVKKELDRASGDYNQFWHDRNYLLNANRVKAEVVFTHGSQDWNVKPLHVFNMFQALPASIKKHLFYHNGAHVYLNNWQSIDFRESMNALLSKKLLGYDSSYELPTVIWQDNTGEQSWTSLDDFGNQTSQRTFSLGDGEKVIQNRYETKDYERYGKAYPTFLSDLYQDKAQQVAIDLPIEEDLHLSGKPRLHLRLHSSTNKGLLSAQLLEFGSKKYLQPYPAVLSVRTLDNGRYHMLDNLTELPFKEAGQRVISKGYLNLQNRHELLEVEAVTPGEWMEFDFDLQPTIYKLEKGATLRLILYTTDFEITVRDQTNYQLTIDLAQSSLHLPEMTEAH